MQIDPKFEASLLRVVDRLLDKQNTSLPRWRAAGQVLLVSGVALSAFSFLNHGEGAFAVQSLLLASLLGGFCIGISLWLLAFAKQWPVLSKYMDRKAIKRRANEPDA